MSPEAELSDDAVEGVLESLELVPEPLAKVDDRDGVDDDDVLFVLGLGEVVVP